MGFILRTPPFPPESTVTLTAVLWFLGGEAEVVSAPDC